MQQEEEKCSYKYQWPFEDRQCQYPNYAEGLCIFHFPKYFNMDDEGDVSNKEKKRKKKELEDKFREYFYAELKKWDSSEDVREFDCIGFCFPAINLRKQILNKYIINGELRKLFNCRQAVFHGQILCFESVFKAKADFTGAIFHQQAIFASTQFHELVSCNTYRFGYRRFSFMRASAVENCQLILDCRLFRSFSQAVIWFCIVCRSGILRSRHCPFRALSSISAMLSQLPCLGV